jgi:signal transduction histidine kinase
MVSFLSLKGKVWTGYVIAFLLLIVSYFLIYFTLQKSMTGTTAVTQSYNVINKLEELRGEVTEAETGVRGYIITRDPRFLAPYDSAIAKIPTLYEDLKALTEDNEQQYKELATFMAIIKERLSYLQTGLIAFRRNGLTVTDSMRLSREPAKRIMDTIRVIETRMQAQEEQMMRARKEALSGFFNSTKIIAMISLAVAFITLFYSLIIFNKENKAKELAIERALRYSVDLEAKIAELKEANHELEELKSLEKFTATGRIARTIAHEVRNPLTNISLAAEQLHESSQANGDSTVLLDMISRNASRINQLVAELLNATRFAHLEYEVTDAKKLMDEILELAKDRIDLKHIRVEKRYSPQPCRINVDAEKMKLALLNIVVNAIEAMESQTGVLTLETRKEGRKCVIEIGDNGEGMTEEILRNLFEPYFTAKANGNGLGLTNTQNIVYNHKGIIKVQSKPGQGSVFIIILDLAETEQRVGNKV